MRKRQLLLEKDIDLVALNKEFRSVKRKTPLRKETAFGISTLAVKKRKLKPSCSNTSLRGMTIRRNDTWKACNTIHGGSKENTDPVVFGMLHTLTSKCKSDNLASKKSLVNNIK